jgi:hypothetical protein
MSKRKICVYFFINSVKNQKRNSSIERMQERKKQENGDAITRLGAAVTEKRRRNNSPFNSRRDNCPG